MTVLLATLLAVPLAGALAVALSRRVAGTVTLAVGVGVAAGWVVLIAGTSGADPATVELGRLTVDPVLAAAVAGLALLLAAAPPRRAFATSAALTGLTVFAAAASVGRPPVPDRPFAAGVLVLTALAVARAWTERSPRTAIVTVAAGGLLVTVGLAVDDPERAAVLVVAGAGVVAATVAASAGPALLLVPVVLLAVQRAATAVPPVPGDVSAMSLAAISAAALAVPLLLWARRRAVTQRLPAAAALAAVVLLSADLGELRSAGLLLAAGAVLSAAGRHPAALLGLAPGVAAAVGAAGLGAELEHAAIGAVVVLVLAAGAVEVRATGAAPTGPWWTAAPGVVFGLVPLWGWAGVDLPGYTEAVAVAAATAFAALAITAAAPVGREAVRRRRGTAPSEETPSPPPPAGPEEPGRAQVPRPRGTRLVVRRSEPADPPDGIAHPD